MEALLQLYNLRVRLDVKLEADSGNVLADLDDTLGTPVVFNKAFKDVNSIVATARSTIEYTVVVDFVDVPNPTGFSVYVFNSIGDRADATVSWVARGVL